MLKFDININYCPDIDVTKSSKVHKYQYQIVRLKKFLFNLVFTKIEQ